MWKKLFRRDEGISALEYALIAVLIALAIIVGARLLGQNMNATFEKAAGELPAVTS
jgi:pilus assembly protein Flp/PilA